MIWLFILTVAFFVFVATPVAYIRGLNVGASNPKPVVYEHQHIWGKWSDQAINYKNQKTGKTDYTVSGQTRTCEDCGFRESQAIQ